jgi:predicted TPR repeat methyltransferase
MMKLNGCEVRLANNADDLDQDEEWILLASGNRCEQIRLHDYGKIYDVPGLYEEVVYDQLKCKSPQVISSMLKKELEKSHTYSENLRVLDFGAGNGISGECLEKEIDCDSLVGVDIVPEAVSATHRDRPGLYDDYYVMDLCEIRKEEKRRLMQWNFNVLITISALGYGDIPSRAFVNAFNLLENDAWIAFNIKDRYLDAEDDSGFRDTLDRMLEGSLSVLQKKRYRHRFSMSGKPIHYVAVVGQKIMDTGT